MSKKVEMDMFKVHKLREEGKTFKEIAEKYGCHRSTVNRRYNKWKKKNDFINKVGSTAVEIKKEEEKSWLEKIKDFFYELIPHGEQRWK